MPRSINVLGKTLSFITLRCRIFSMIELRTATACAWSPGSSQEWCITSVPYPANARRIEPSPCAVPICVPGGGGGCGVADHCGGDVEGDDEGGGDVGFEGDEY